MDHQQEVKAAPGGSKEERLLGPWEGSRDDETGGEVFICRGCEMPYPCHERGCQEGA